MKDDGLLVSLRLSGRRCLVIGAGDEAAERAARLLDTGADVQIVADGAGEAVRELATRGLVTLTERPFAEADLDGCRLAVLTDRDEDLAARLDEACAARNVLFCAVDQPAHGDYAHVAIVRRGHLSVGISTGGRVPALASRLREELTRLFDSERLDAFMSELEDLRARAAAGDRGRLLRKAARRLSIVGRLEIEDDE